MQRVSVLILPSERARFPLGAVLRNFATAADLDMEITESYAGTLAASFAHQRAHSAIKRKYHGSGTCQLYAATEKAQLPQSLMAAMPAGPHRPKHRFGCLLDRVPEKERRRCKGVETFSKSSEIRRRHGSRGSLTKQHFRQSSTTWACSCFWSLMLFCGGLSSMTRHGATSVGKNVGYRRGVRGSWQTKPSPVVGCGWNWPATLVALGPR